MIYLSEERLAAMPFLEYLKEMLSKVKGIRHVNKSNVAYSDSRDLCRHIKSRFVKELKLTWEEFDTKIGHSLKLSEDELDKYRYAKSDKAKAAVIKDFVDNYSYDLQSYILARERNKQSPDTPVEY